jgi:DNA-binding ferritin-like protein
MAALIDTHKLYTEFTESGFEPRQAETLIRAVQSGQDQLATKQDIDELRTATKQDIDVLKRDIESLRKDNKQDIEVLKKDIETLSAKVDAKIADLKSELSIKIAESKNAIWMAVFLLLAAQIASHFWK